MMANCIYQIMWWWSYQMNHSLSQRKMIIFLFSNRPLDPCDKKDKSGHAHTLHNKDYWEPTTKTYIVECIHYDIWPNSANSFITRRKPSNWPSNSMLENIKSQWCDVALVGHHDSKNNDIQLRISFSREQNLLNLNTWRRSGVVVPHKAYVFECEALFMSMGRLKLH